MQTQAHCWYAHRNYQNVGIFLWTVLASCSLSQCNYLHLASDLKPTGFAQSMIFISCSHTQTHPTSLVFLDFKTSVVPFIQHARETSY